MARDKLMSMSANYETIRTEIAESRNTITFAKAQKIMEQPKLLAVMQETTFLALYADDLLDKTGDQINQQVDKAVLRQDAPEKPLVKEMKEDVAVHESEQAFVEKYRGYPFEQVPLLWGHLEQKKRPLMRAVFN